MNRSRDFYRKQRAKHISRKKRMIQEWSANCAYWITEDGKLSKGKIHCSCWMCRSKSFDNKKANDLARIEAMNESERYYFDPNGYDMEEDDAEYINNDAQFRYWEEECNYYPEESYY